ncbi:hypothetical protein [Maritimibacter sp. 55A14]|nr:hypothetical protein [Maritimibacter sp. 55A14]
MRALRAVRAWVDRVEDSLAGDCLGGACLMVFFWLLTVVAGVLQ